MHGGSGVAPEDYTKAIAAGIRKINYYSYMSKAGYLAAKKVIESNKPITCTMSNSLPPKRWKRR
jgi:fructose-bisphosphate aldolase, class II